MTQTYYSDFFPDISLEGAEGSVNPLITSQQLADIQAALNGISDDNVLTEQEKVSTLIPTVASLDQEWSELDALAASVTNVDVIAARAAADTAKDEWYSYLAALVPAWNDTDQPTTIVRLEFYDALNNYVAGIKNLLKELTRYSGTIAEWGNIIDNDPSRPMPEDGATRNVVRGTWAEGQIYYGGDIVLESGSSYSCLVSHTSAEGNKPPHAYWQLLASVGSTSAVVLIYKRSSVVPALPTTTATYNFSTKVLTGLDNGWSTSVPTSNGDPLYVSGASAFGTNATDNILASEWTAPTILAQDGAAGAKNASVFLYQRTSTDVAPTKPSTVTTYTFSTSTATGYNNGWTQSVPASGGAYLWIIVATASSTGTTDTINDTEWSTPALLAQDGVDGLNNAVVQIFKRSATVPALPTATTTYTFSTTVLSGLDNGWTTTVPTSDGNPLYTSAATASSIGTSDTIASAEWATPTLLVQDGFAFNSATVFLYQRTSISSAPTKPSTASTYTFSTGALTGYNNGWSQAVPSGGRWLWVTTATAISTAATDGIASTEWSAPAILSLDGLDGTDGSNGTNGTSPAVANITRDAHTLFTYADGSVITYGNATGQFTLMCGGSDAIGTATLSAVGTGCSGTINTSNNVPVNGQPKGYYRVTAITADEAYLTMDAVLDGVTYTKIFSLAKVKAGYEIVSALPGTNLFEGRVVFLTTDDKLYRYTGSAWTKAVDGGDIAANSILANAIGAGEITTAKLASTEISAMFATIGVLRTATIGARMEYRDNVIKLYDSSNTLRVQIGDLSL